MLGETFGSYRITGRISEGGMGVVYRAEHLLLGRAAAVKVLLPMWSENHEVVQRFFNEARATSSIRHPGIVEVFDFGHCPLGRAFLVMELLSGEPLAHRMARSGPMLERDAVRLGHRVAAALAAAHARGIVHRDLKPDNVFLVPDDAVDGGERPKILDFGIAKLTSAHADGGATRVGVVLGTPAYMSPEQCRGAGDVDARADLYSLGCILYEAIAGRPPFVAAGQGELIGQHLYVEPEPLRMYAPHASEAIEALVARLLSKRADDRPASALDVVAALGEIAAGANAAGDVGWRSWTLTPAPQPAGPTTLGSSAGATPTGPVAATVRPRRWRAAGIAGGVLAAGAMAIVWLGMGAGAGASTSGPAARPRPQAIDAGVDASVPDAGTEPDAVTDSVPVSDSVPVPDSVPDRDPDTVRVPDTAPAPRPSRRHRTKPKDLYGER